MMPPAAAGERFLKRNRSPFADHLRKEASGLEALRHAAAGSGIEVPEVLRVDEQWLELTRIRAVAASPAQWERLGRGLAAIHAVRQPRFGFPEDNYIGLNPQRNTPGEDWGRFFLEQRLAFQVALVRDAQRQREYRATLDRQAKRLVAFLGAQDIAPALLHGDLWSGNVLFDANGSVWLIDPAVYWGDPEADIAMTEMFGGFAPQFLAAYRAQHPPSASYERKRRIYNLYHALNHLHLFGDSYLDACEAGWAGIEAL